MSTYVCKSRVIAYLFDTVHTVFSLVTHFSGDLLVGMRHYVFETEVVRSLRAGFQPGLAGVALG